MTFARSADIISFVQPNQEQRRGILLVNLGSPAAPTVPALRAYLNQFLMDPEVIDLPWPVRRLLVSCFILPTRPQASAAAYASIWRDQAPGSPLIYHSGRVRDALAQHLDVPVALGMRYGEPSIATALAALSNCNKILLIAAYPHHADSTRTTTIKTTRALLTPAQKLTVLPPFFERADYIEVLANSIRTHLPQDWEHLLFSYHGLPERHITKADPSGTHCLQTPDCCTTASPAHATCYRHQVLATTEAVRRSLNLADDQVSVSYQSRLGRTPWLTPDTKQLLTELPKRGIKNLAVVCPAFVADNLETLEEIGIRGAATFKAAGGQRLTLIPCLNSDAAWINLLADWCKTSL